jgi:polyisoprenyl-phosphate glycosyltransferase
MFSVVIPVYRNAEFVPMLVAEFTRIDRMVRERFHMDAEFVFVVDGSPDDSHAQLAAALPVAPFRSQLVCHARNFGSFAAIRTGLHAARGEYFAVIAADLQEPPELLLAFLETMMLGDRDVVVGVREARNDPAASRRLAQLYWRAYRRFIFRDIPRGGVDVFGCNKTVRDELLKLDEAHTSLVGLIFWLGFRRAQVPYTRRAREHGKSAWTFRKKVKYLLDSVFSFTDLPIRALTIVGMLGTVFAILFALVVVVLRLTGAIQVPGYAATIIVIAFFGALNMFGLGLVGSYAWRAYENTKRRPLATIQSVASFAGSQSAAASSSALRGRVPEQAQVR